MTHSATPCNSRSAFAFQTAMASNSDPLPLRRYALMDSSHFRKRDSLMPTWAVVMMYVQEL